MFFLYNDFIFVIITNFAARVYFGAANTKYCSRCRGYTLYIEKGLFFAF